MPLPKSATRVPRTLARDEAYRRLVQWVIDGTLRPGEVLRDHDIAATLGVSRTPVREALRRLEDEGLVETALNRWTRVAALDLTRVAEVYSIIEVLEVLALELAFPKIAGHDLERMTDANHAMQSAAEQQRPAPAVIADEAFHEVWIDCAGNSELSLLLRQLKMKLRRVELAYFDAPSRAHQSFREHVAIVRALKRRSLPEATASLQRNWRGSVDRLNRFVQRQKRED
jgi:DNA-binding GntR family transcriptional regulator